MFPFLIGRIRTNGKISERIQKYGFPFLIGRIRTRRATNSVNQMFLTLFPFLIGRIRTTT